MHDPSPPLHSTGKQQLSLFIALEGGLRTSRELHQRMAAKSGGPCCSRRPTSKRPIHCKPGTKMDLGGGE
jgi:hypothetical protein